MTACLILNPRAGRSRAELRIARLLRSTTLPCPLLRTEGPGHARRLASEAVRQGCSLVIAAGGDGTVHEVACGMLETEMPDLAMGVLPIGSANDFAWSIQRQVQTAQHSIRLAAHGFSTPTYEMNVDVGVATTLDSKREYFIESLGTGLSGWVMAESRSIAWMQGISLYAWATFRALLRYRPVTMTLRCDETHLKDSTLLFSALLGNREGSFVLAPDARNDDGKLDYIHARSLPLWKSLWMIPRVALAGPPRNDPAICLGQCKEVEVTSDSDLVVHIDGELFASLSDHVRSLKIELLPKRLHVAIFDTSLDLTPP